MAERVVARRALLIDDSAKLRTVVRLALELDGWVVVGESEDGAQGLDLAVALQPDAIVLDHQMPVQTGLEALPRLRQVCPRAVIVMWTSDPDVTERATALGADALVDKAEALDALLAALRRAA